MGLIALRRQKHSKTPWRVTFVADDAAEQLAIEQIPGACKGKDIITFPADPAIVRAIRDELPEAQIEEDCLNWYTEQTGTAKESIVAKLDHRRVDLDVPWASRLYDFQTSGAHWLRTVHRGILADE